MTKYGIRMAAALLVASVIPTVHAQERREHDFERARNVIAKTREDLQHIERHDAFVREDHERYERVMRELSEMQRDLDDHRLDRERLGRAAEDVDHVAHVGMVGPRERERLMDDSRDLRRLREDWR